MLANNTTFRRNRILKNLMMKVAKKRTRRDISWIRRNHRTTNLAGLLICTNSNKSITNSSGINRTRVPSIWRGYPCIWCSRCNTPKLWCSHNRRWCLTFSQTKLTKIFQWWWSQWQLPNHLLIWTLSLRCPSKDILGLPRGSKSRCNSQSRKWWSMK